MKIFSCEERFESMMTCIYEAWEEALSCGHGNVKVQKGPIVQQTLFDEYIHVDCDMEKAMKVIRSIKNKISMEAYVHIYYASLSCSEDALQVVYDFLRVGFQYGKQACCMYTIPCVMRLMELRRKVGNEAQYFREFARFHSIDNHVYVCHLEPKDNVIWLVGEHFADRMPSEHFMIVDDNRRIAVVHPKEEQSYMRFLTEDEYFKIAQTEQIQDKYTDMWKGFFQAISIKERENRTCQRNLFPVWMRKHATEFQSD